MIEENILDNIKKDLFKTNTAKFVLNKNLEYSNGLDKFWQFQKYLDYQLQQISEATELEQIKQSMKNIQTSFDYTWEQISKEPNIDHNLKDFLSRMFLEKHLGSPDMWISGIVSQYEKKENLGFFKKTINNFLDKFSSTIEKPKYQFIMTTEVEQLSLEIINKFNLKYINLNTAKTPEEAIEFLKKFDTVATETFKELGTTVDVCGIKNSIGLTFQREGLAHYWVGDSSINFTLNHLTPTIILHEWVHAFDNIVCKQLTNINSFSSERESMFIKDESALSKTYEGLRSLTRELFVNKKEEIKILTKILEEDGCKKYWSEILGNKYYSLSEDQKQQLLTPQNIKLINNYLVARNVNDESKILKTIRNIGIDEDSLDRFSLRKKTENLSPSVVEFFEDANKNLHQISNSSLYYVFSNLQCKLQNTLNSMFKPIDKLLNKCSNNQIIKNNAEATNYWVQPCEMLARYFESQVFLKQATFFNALSLIPVYKTYKEDDFEQKKNELLSNFFGKDKVLKNIANFREEQEQKQNNINHKLKS